MSILKDLKTNPKWSNTEIAIASCCDEPSWAAECIRKFGLGDGLTLKVKFLGLELDESRSRCLDMARCPFSKCRDKLFEMSRSRVSIESTSRQIETLKVKILINYKIFFI
jgi:hypothetical protein